MDVVQLVENADAERDVYEELLTQAEIQGNVNKINCKSHQPLPPYPPSPPQNYSF